MSARVEDEEAAMRPSAVRCSSCATRSSIPVGRVPSFKVTSVTSCGTSANISGGRPMDSAIARPSAPGGKPSSESFIGRPSIDGIKYLRDSEVISRSISAMLPSVCIAIVSSGVLGSSIGAGSAGVCLSREPDPTSTPQLPHFAGFGTTSGTRQAGHELSWLIDSAIQQTMAGDTTAAFLAKQNHN